MVASFFKVQVTQDEIARIAKTSENGTDNEEMLKVLTHVGINAKIVEPATFADIEQCLEEGKVSIVNYIEPKDREGHFAVVVGLNPTHIILHDPWHGPNFKLERQGFFTDWHSETGKHVRWLLVASGLKVA